MSFKTGDYFRPRTVVEASSLLVEGGGSRLAIAGGTGVMLKRGRQLINLVDLWGCGMNKITERVEDGLVEFGSMLTVNQLGESAYARELAGGIIAEACHNVASISLRNLITLGGNLVQLHPWSDLPPVFLALDATIVITHSGTERVVNSETFFNQNPRTNLQPGDLVTAVHVPASCGRRRGCFTKFRTNHVDYSLVTAVSSCVIDNGGRATEVRLVAGALGVHPVRLSPIEALLEGQELTDELIEMAAVRVRDVIHPSRDLRVSADYRREVFTVLLKRQLRALRCGEKHRHRNQVGV